MERWAVLLGLDTMPFPTHFDPLPPLGSCWADDSPLLTNFDTDFEEESVCLKCPGKLVPPELLSQHKNWHVRTNLLLGLRDLVIRDSLGGGFGPGKTGALVVMDYENATVWQKSTETEEDLAHFLNSKCETLVKLRCVDGLKTTVGNKFTSRKEGGDFVILNLDASVPLLGDDDGDYDYCRPAEWFVSPKEVYFQLECRNDGAIWISNKVETSSPTIVFVNGVPLYDAKPLKFGDVLSISIDDGRRGKRGCDLIFKEILLQSNPGNGSLIMENEEVIDISRDEAQEKSLSNYLIVQNIIRWLPTTTMVKDARLVARLWNKEALNVLKERDREVIVTVYNPEGHPNMQMSNFTHSQLGPLGLSNWKIELPFFGHNNRQDQYHIDSKVMEQQAHIRSMQQDKVLDDLTWFMEQPHSHDVRTLILSGSLDSSPKCVQMYQVLMSGLKEVLTSLTLTLNVVKDIYFTSPPLLVDSLTALQRLTIRVVGSSNEQAIERVVSGLLPSFGSITALCIPNGAGHGEDGWWEWRQDNQKFGMMVLSEVAKIQSTDPTKFGALTTIDLRRSSGEDASNIEPLSLLKRNSLESISLGEILTISRSSYFPQLRRVLSTHAATLRHVTLQFSIVDQHQLHIPLPDRMESLESLTFRFEFKSSFVSNHRWMALFTGNSRRVVNYSQCLPSLSKLSLWPVKRIEEGQKETLVNNEWMDWALFSPILAAFFATGTNANGQRVPVASVTALDIPFLLNGRYHQVLDDLEALFPNADFPQGLQSSRWFERWIEPVVPE